MERVKIAIIGLGWFGEIHCDAISGIPNLEIAALCTRNESRLAELSKKYGVKDTYTDYRDVLARDDIDAVSIVTMWDQHTDPTVAALAATAVAAITAASFQMPIRRPDCRTSRLNQMIGRR